MGKHTVKFSCKHCGHCCRDVVCLPTPYDVVRLVRETGEDPYDFLEFITPDDISKVSKSDPTWLSVDGKKYIMALRRTAAGCFFLNKRTKHCLAYEARPLLCRLYPFALHETREGDYNGFSLQKDVECPRKRDQEVRALPLYDIYVEDRRHQEDYNDLVRFFNSRAQSDPRHFVKLFIQKV